MQLLLLVSDSRAAALLLPPPPAAAQTADDQSDRSCWLDEPQASDDAESVTAYCRRLIVGHQKIMASASGTPNWWWPEAPPAACSSFPLPPGPPPAAPAAAPSIPAASPAWPPPPARPPPSWLLLLPGTAVGAPFPCAPCCARCLCACSCTFMTARSRVSDRIALTRACAGAETPTQQRQAHQEESTTIHKQPDRASQRPRNST